MVIASIQVKQLDCLASTVYRRQGSFSIPPPKISLLSTKTKLTTENTVKRRNITSKFKVSSSNPNGEIYAFFIFYRFN